MCDYFIFDKLNLDSNFYFSVAAFEEWGWLLLLSVSFTSGNNKHHLTGLKSFSLFSETIRNLQYSWVIHCKLEPPTWSCSL